MVEQIDLTIVPMDDWFFRISTCLTNNESFVIFDSSEVGKDIDVSEFINSNEIRVGIFSSGSTGKPKLLIHSLASLLGFNQSQPANWMTLYRPDRMAGLQAAIHAWKGGGCLYFLSSGTSYKKISGPKKRYLSNINYLSGTPSHFRQIDPELLKRCTSLNAVTLGGESVSQKDIDRIKLIAPQTRVYHVYASSEFGAMCTVKDELAGLPLSFFKGSVPRFRINNDGELCVKPFSVAVSVVNSKTSLRSYFKTGDLGEIQNNRFYFMGRKDSLVSVGGVLTSPESIESALANLSEVKSCRIVVKSNPMLGAILVAEVVPSNDSVTDESILHYFIGEPIWRKPHIIKFCDSIEISVAGKILRR